MGTLRVIIKTLLGFFVFMFIVNDYSLNTTISVLKEDPVRRKVYLILYAVVLLIALLEYLVKKRKEDKIRDYYGSIEYTINSLTPYEYEEACAVYYKSKGYNCDVTPKSGDFGADIIAAKKSTGERVAIQCKLYSATHKVGVKAIQEVIAAKSFYNCNGAVVITTSGFTEQAKEMARKTNVKLEVLRR